jgi:hypothetical protein
MDINPEIEFWDCSEDAELLGHESKDDAIEARLDEELYDIHVESWPKTVTVYGFAREVPKWDREAQRVLDRFLEDLDEPYGNPEEATDQTDAMLVAAKEFVEKIKAEYQVWSCRRVTSEEINVMEWVKEHCPHWLDEPKTSIPLLENNTEGV